MLGDTKASSYRSWLLAIIKQTLHFSGSLRLIPDSRLKQWEVITFCLSGFPITFRYAHHFFLTSRVLSGGVCSTVMGDCKAHWYQIYFLIPKFLDSPGPVNMRNVTENCHQKSSKLCDHLKFEWSLNFSTWTLENKAHIDIFCSVTFFFYPYFSFLQQVFLPWHHICLTWLAHFKKCRVSSLHTMLSPRPNSRWLTGPKSERLS